MPRLRPISRRSPVRRLAGALPRRRRELRADRTTKALAAGGVVIFGAVLAGEFRRLYRVRVHQHHPETLHTSGPVDAARLAGRASRDTVRVALEGLNATTRRETVLFHLLNGFVGAFVLARLSTLGIRSGWWPFGNVRLGGRHVHHFVPGIALAFGTGAAAMITESERIETTLAIPFGIGVGLTLDEAALLLDLRDVYWSSEGLLSVQLSLGLASVLGATILGMRVLRRGEARTARAGLIPASPPAGIIPQGALL